MNSPPVVSVVLDGGPCGGKSTFPKHIAYALQTRRIGAPVLCIFAPEPPTYLMLGNVHPAIVGNLPFHREVVRHHLHNHMVWIQTARALAAQYGLPCVVLFDRQVLSVEAYFPKESARAILEILLGEFGMSRQDILSRYPLLVHVVTTAYGAESVYEARRKDNPTRTEEIPLARERDDRTREAWADHPRRIIVPNSDEKHKPLTAEDRIDLIVTEIFKIVDSFTSISS